jgi:hypothetical protein
MDFTKNGRIILQNLGRRRCTVGGSIWANISMRLIPDDIEAPGFIICLRVTLKAPDAVGSIPEREAESVYREVEETLHKLESQMRVRVIEFPRPAAGGLWPLASLDQLFAEIGHRAKWYDV